MIGSTGKEANRNEQKESLGTSVYVVMVASSSSTWARRSLEREEPASGKDRVRRGKQKRDQPEREREKLLSAYRDS